MKHAVISQSDTLHRSPAAVPVAARSFTPASVEFLDNRPEAVAQRRLAEAIHNSRSMVAQRRQLRGLFGEAAQLKGGPEEEDLVQGKFAPIQRRGPEDEELLQGKFEVHQRKGLEEEEPLQGRFEEISSAQLKEEAPKPNNTGLPDNLKSGIESLSGLAMDDVTLHYNSSQPARLNALAYTRGSEIHVAPGQEHHLPHEAWHVVQQAQGRVQPTMQLKDGVPVNDDAGLEHEADVMGGKALSSRAQPKDEPPQRQAETIIQGVVQRTIYDDEIGTIVWTSDFDQKHFACSIEEALKNGNERLKTAAFKDFGARPSMNSVIIYTEDLLFNLKETILKNQLANTTLTFNTQLIVQVGQMRSSILSGASVTVGINEKGQINHLNSVTAGSPDSSLEFAKKPQRTKFEDD